MEYSGLGYKLAEPSSNIVNFVASNSRLSNIFEHFLTGPLDPFSEKLLLTELESLLKSFDFYMEP